MGVITQNYMEALGKQIFAKDFILNGLFPCQSSFVKMIDLARVDWKFNDRFEYRMLMSNTNSGGTINTQTFDENFRLTHPGDLEYATFQVSYGSLMDGFNIDMMKQLETRESRAAFNKEYAMRLHSMRINVASLFKNFAIHGRYGVMHRLMPPLDMGSGVTRYPVQIFKAGTNYANITDQGIPDLTKASWADAAYAAGTSPTPGTWTMNLVTGDHIRIFAPRNVFASNFKNGRLISRASAVTGSGSDSPAPWGKSLIDEMYVVYQNQPSMLELVYIGSAGVASWNAGDFLQVAGNRKVPLEEWKKWTLGSAKAAQSEYVAQRGYGSTSFWTWSGGTTGAVYSDSTGAMEGVADLIPWYTRFGVYDSDPLTRLGIDLPFRGQRDRMKYTAEQAGLLVLQHDGQSIMDAIMEGVDISVSVYDRDDVVIFINPVTFAVIGMYEQMRGGNNGGLQVYKESQLDNKLIYQRGITGMSYRIGEKIIPNVVLDYNFPTDVILLAPRKDLQYNCWDNAAFELSQYIQETFSGKKPPPPKDLNVPKEIATKLDLSSRIIYGSPVAQDLDLVQPAAWGSQGYGTNGFVHPSNSIPVAYQEMGALFTENPYAYTVVKLRNQIVTESDVVSDNWANPL
jgi:hypothetical protein